MTRNALPPRKRRRPFDALVGVAPQFERTDGGYFYRAGRTGPAIRVTAAERDAFVRDGLRTFLYHVLALVLCGAAAWLITMRILPDASPVVHSVTIGTIVSAAAILLILSHDWTILAPARALAGRPAEKPPCDPDFVKRYEYATIGAGIFIALLWLVTGSPDFAYRAFFAVVAVLVGGFMLIRRISAYRALPPDLRKRSIAAHASEASYQRERLAGAKPVNGCGLILFFLLEAALGLLVLFGTVAAVLGIAGEPTNEPDGWIFAGGFVLGIVLASLVVGLLDKLCKRWTGASAMNSFDWLPIDW